jgi:ATP-dependent helicase/nuclease subunit B
MPEGQPSVFTIPAHRSFADSLVAGLMRQYGREPLALAGGRILLPNNRAVRTVTEAFVRASGRGLVLPRLIAIGNPDLDDRIGGALDPADASEPVPPAIDPMARELALAVLVRAQSEGAAEALRIAADLARTLDALAIEEVPAANLRDIAADDPELARHWQVSLERLRAIIELWPAELKRRGVIDLAERRNRLLRALPRRQSLPCWPPWRAYRKARSFCPAWPWRRPCRTRNGTRSGRTMRDAGRKAIRSFT